jgi:hypothetical protein
MKRIFESFKDSLNIPKIQFLMLFGNLSSPSNKKQIALNEKTRDLFFEYFLIPDEDERTKDSLKPEDIILDSVRPIINYRRERSKDILENNKIKECYNHPSSDFTFTSDKVKFHENLNKFDFIPKTVFSLKEIENLTFPIIAKPADGLSGLGIEKFDSIEEAQKSKLKFDLWSECVDFKREFRSIFLKDNLVIVYERIPSGDGDMVVGKKKPDEKIEFSYIEQDIKELEFVDELKTVAKQIRDAGMNTDLFSLDIFIDKKGKLWVIEANSGTGLGSNSLVRLYEAIYKDFYKEEPSKYIKLKLKEISDKYLAIIKEDYHKEYKKSYKPL